MKKTLLITALFIVITVLMAVNASSPIVLADDWQCSETGWIKDIHFWGAWMNDNEGEITSFTIKIFSDIPADPPYIPFSKPGQELWSRTITAFIVTDPITSPPQAWFDPSFGEYVEDDHSIYWQYNIFLEQNDWFWQEEGTIYWLSISAQISDGVWGCNSTLDRWNDAVVWTWGDYLWLPAHEPPGNAPYKPGDLDGDGNVDWDDLYYLENWAQGGPPPRFVVWIPDGQWWPTVDVNGDCSITGADFSVLVGYLESGGSLGYCDDFPAGGSGTSLDLAFVINGGAEDIPTLGEWGMLIFALLILAVGTIAVIRRHKTASVVE